jgi:hypothetical protein
MPASTVAAPGASRCCGAVGCAQPWISLLPTGDIKLTILQAVFGLDAGEGEVVRVCRGHYRKIRSQDGYTLGYTKVNGKIKAYVKEEHF